MQAEASPSIGSALSNFKIRFDFTVLSDYSRVYPAGSLFLNLAFVTFNFMPKEFINTSGIIPSIITINGSVDNSAVRVTDGVAAWERLFPFSEGTVATVIVLLPYPSSKTSLRPALT